MNITRIVGRQIFDSRGFPTVECDVYLEDGIAGRAAVPSGASTGSGEALELRDGGDAFGGKGVSQAVANINDRIAAALVGFDASDQKALDAKLIELDGTDNKSGLGANATLAVSLAAAKAVANDKGVELYEHIGSIVGNTTYTLPVPMLNILNGGKHADGSTDIQEFMIIPIGAKSFGEVTEIASNVYHNLGKVLKESGYGTTVGDEGGYAPAVHGGSIEAAAHILEAIQRSGYTLGAEVALALDVASSELYKDGTYDFAREGRTYSSSELIELYRKFHDEYNVISIEDGLAENDWDGWKQLTAELGGMLQLVGDDLLVTNTKLLQRAIDENAANAILIKPNQIGTLSETIEAVQMAKAAGWNTIISHRSGETEDTTIAHIAVGLNAGQIKTGSFSRSDRIAKYNELIRIAETLQSPNLAKPFAK